MNKGFVLFLLLSTPAFNSIAADNSLDSAIENGLKYLESVQLDRGEFPTIFTPNVPEPARSLNASFDSNVFTTAMLADALYSIKNPRVERMQKKVVSFLQAQLHSEDGLWSYFTTHNPAPLYPNTIYDLDDTAFASIVLQQNQITFPNNVTAIKANKNQDGLYLTFVLPPKESNDIDCGVNANVISYLQENDPAVCRYLNEQVATGKNCAEYYTLLDAYYLISRAYASGISCLEPSTPAITNYVLNQFDQQNGSVNDSPFKTAIALNTLQFLKYQGPEIQQARAYLLNTQSTHTGAWPADDFWLWAGTDDEGNEIMMGRSSSSALTTAIALRALSGLR